MPLKPIKVKPFKIPPKKANLKVKMGMKSNKYC